MFDDLATLRSRRSSKWVEYPPDVLPAFVAEMDVALAPAVRAALIESIERGDTGYAARRSIAWRPPSPVSAIADLRRTGSAAQLLHLRAVQPPVGAER